MEQEKWYAYYDYSSKGTRCNKNVEPSKNPKSSCYRHFPSEQAAINSYKESLTSHVKSILCTMGGFTNKQMDARLRKYGLAKQADLLNHLQKMVEEAYKEV